MISMTFLLILFQSYTDKIISTLLIIIAQRSSTRMLGNTR